jgi:hypothetical protein
MTHSTIQGIAILMAVAIAAVAAIVILIAKAVRGKLGASLDYRIDRRRFLTPREADAFRMLVPIAATLGLHVCPQASIDAFLSFTGEGRFRERGRYKARRSDFAMMDGEGDVVMAIEIDDASHRGKEDSDKARDAALAMAGIPTLRVPAGKLPDRLRLRDMVQSRLASAKRR